MTTLDIAHLRELLARATPSSRWSVASGNREMVIARDTADAWETWLPCDGYQNAEQDAAIIVAAVNALPQLLDECERLRHDVHVWRSVAGEKEVKLSEDASTKILQSTMAKLTEVTETARADLAAMTKKARFFDERNLEQSREIIRIEGALDDLNSRHARLVEAARAVLISVRDVLDDGAWGDIHALEAAIAGEPK